MAIIQNVLRTYRNKAYDIIAPVWKRLEEAFMLIPKYLAKVNIYTKEYKYKSDEQSIVV